LNHANRTLQMISQCDWFLVRATEEVGLLRDICRILVESGGYRLAWAGFAEEDEGRTVRPVAYAGFEEGYLENVNITWADTERGLGPAGTAIRTGQPCLIRKTLTGPNFTPWRAEELKRGYASSIGLPLVANHQSFGVLMVYAAAPDAFDEAEVDLLIELADNLAYGITALRTRAERQRAEEALRVSNDQVANILNSISDAFFALDEHLLRPHRPGTPRRLPRSDRTRVPGPTRHARI
jgi:GAF domain-containing protein